MENCVINNEIAMKSTNFFSTVMESADNISPVMESADNVLTVMESADNVSTVMESADNVSTAMGSTDNVSTDSKAEISVRSKFSIRKTIYGIFIVLAIAISFSLLIQFGKITVSDEHNFTSIALFT
ncbi:hypothetical protein TrispH2_009867, partial [Trichoplax sp. H2]